MADPAKKPLPSFEELSRPLPAWHPKAWVYGLLGLSMRSIGGLSEGIRIGFAHGFDSGVMLEHVYRNEAKGITPLGRLIDRVYLDSAGWAGIRRRGAILTGTLTREIAATAAAGRAPVLLDVACGGGRYDVEALASLPDITVTATLRDYAEANVEKAKALAAENGVTATIEAGDAFSDADLARVDPKPNIVVVSGLHEILSDDALIENHYKQLAAIMDRPATLIFTVQPWHPQVELIARALPAHTGKLWVMRLRSIELVQGWAEAAGFADFSVEMEEAGIFGVVTCRLN